MKFGPACAASGRTRPAPPTSEPAPMLDVLALAATAMLAYVYTMRPQSRG